jgi:SAM-dependent methyltransferase
MGIRAVLRLLGKRIADFDRILDFGCGSARVLRWFQDVQKKTELYGCDLNPDAIDWSKKNIHFAKFALNEKLPPLPYKAGFFDFIYGISVVTHLDQELHMAWLEELARIVSEDGIVMLTVHGRDHAQMDLTAEDYQEFLSRGFLYRKATTPSTVEGLPEFYQVAFHDTDYIRQTWGQWFEVIGSMRHGTMYRQEAILLRKRKVKTSIEPTLVDLPIGMLEVPLGSISDGELSIRGWAFYPDQRPAELDIWIDSTLVARVRGAIPRRDVARFFHGFPTALESGFELVVPLQGFTAGTHVIWSVPPGKPFPVAATHFSRREGLGDDFRRATADVAYRARCAVRIRTRLRRLFSKSS